MIDSTPYSRVAIELNREIENQLERVGILCRVFGRGKSSKSLEIKLRKENGKYGVGKKLIQDAIGIRIVSYFQEDVQIIERLLRKRYQCDEDATTIDKPSSNHFSVSRHNLVFKLPPHFYRDIKSPTDDLPVDQSFEVQIRTILSEGMRLNTISDTKEKTTGKIMMISVEA